MAYLKPQSPLIIGEDHIYPLTTYDQIINKDGNRVSELVDGKDISYLYSATFDLDSWSGSSSPYTQTVALTPLDGGPTTTSTSAFASPSMCKQTTNQETNETLQATLALFNNGYLKLGSGTITATLFEKPTNDIEVIWSIKKGGV